MTLDKSSLAREWIFAQPPNRPARRNKTGRVYNPNGKRECARRRRQMCDYQLSLREWGHDPTREWHE